MLHPPAEDFDAEEVASNPSAAFPAPADPDDQGTLTEPTVTRDAVAPPAPPPPPPQPPKTWLILAGVLGAVILCALAVGGYIMLRRRQTAAAQALATAAGAKPEVTPRYLL